MDVYKTALRSAARIWGYYLIMALVCLLFLNSVGNTALTLILNALLLAAFLAIALNDGGYNGERASTLAASLEKQRADGRRVAAESVDQVWSVKSGVAALLICLLPFLALCTVNVLVAPMYPEAAAIEAEPAQEPEATPRPAVIPSGSAEAEAVPTNYVNILARFLFMPFVSVYLLVSGSTLNWLFFLFALPMPIAQFVGYMMGPRLREKKLKDIARGKRRKMRALKVNKKPPRPPKAEV